MATMQELENAIVRADAAGNVDDARLLAAEIRRMRAEQAASKPQAQPDPTANMSGPERFAAGLASGVLGAGRQVLQAGNDLAEWIDSTAVGGAINRAGQAIGLPSTAEARRPMDAARIAQRERDAPLLETGAGKAGNIVGTIAAVAPTAAVPGANTYLGAGLLGAGTGAVLADKGERLPAAAIGAVGGVGGKWVGDNVLAPVLTRAVDLAKGIAGRQTAEQTARMALEQSLAQNGLKISDLPAKAADDLLAEVRRAVSVGGSVDDAALARKADFLAIGAKPTLGTITRDPQQFAYEQTLRGVNGAGSELADIATQNNAALIRGLNEAGAARAADPLATGQQVVDSLGKYAAKQQAGIRGLYQAAEDVGGQAIPLDHVAFTNAAADAVDAKRVNAFLPTEVKGILNDIAEGKMPLNVSTTEQLKTILADSIREASRQGKGNTVTALRAVYGALEETPPATQLGADALAAFRAARDANRAFKTTVENTPALQAVLDGAEPDKFFQRQILGGDVASVKKTVGLLGDAAPEARQAVKDQVVMHLKDKALSGAADEVGNFSQSAYNRALKSLGEPKLKALGFTQDEIARLKLIGRVASYQQAAPAGAVVNRSGTAAQSYNLLMGLLGKAQFSPVLGPMVVQPALGGLSSLAAGNAARAAVPATPGTAFGLLQGTAPAAGSILLNEAYK